MPCHSSARPEPAHHPSPWRLWKKYMLVSKASVVLCPGCAVDAGLLSRTNTAYVVGAWSVGETPEIGLGWTGSGDRKDDAVGCHARERGR
jgi:hypothetical protein